MWKLLGILKLKPLFKFSDTHQTLHSVKNRDRFFTTRYMQWWNQHTITPKKEKHNSSYIPGGQRDQSSAPGARQRSPPGGGRGNASSRTGQQVHPPAARGQRRRALSPCNRCAELSEPLKQHVHNTKSETVEGSGSCWDEVNSNYGVWEALGAVSCWAGVTLVEAIKSD